MSKADRLTNLYGEYKKKFHGEEIVLGEGNVDGKLLLIGEAPGKDEVKLSKPFVGQAGKNLNEFLEILNIERGDIYITNAVKYRLFKVNAKTERASNRPASKEDIEKSRCFLLDEVQIINPSYIITLGTVPLKSITGEHKASIGDVHGTLQEISIEKRSFKLFPLYHPASIIYNRSLKGVYVNDIKNLKNLL